MMLPINSTSPGPQVIHTTVMHRFTATSGLTENVRWEYVIGLQELSENKELSAHLSGLSVISLVWVD